MSDNKEEMKVDVARARTLASNLKAVAERVSGVSKGRNVRIVAVSKLKPATDILALHQAPTSQEHFGENYAQELIEKAEMLPSSIKWHFIGGLQSTISIHHPQFMVRKLSRLLEKANQLDLGRASLPTPASSPLYVHVQVNTSGEESKSGCQPGSETLELCKHIHTDCKNLKLLGLMTIGAIARSKEMTPETENEDFECLSKERDAVAKELGLSELELSMGMSDDMETAIVQGSDEVRVGSTIFGTRPPKADFKVKEGVEQGKS